MEQHMFRCEKCDVYFRTKKGLLLRHSKGTCLPQRRFDAGRSWLPVDILPADQLHYKSGVRAPPPSAALGTGRSQSAQMQMIIDAARAEGAEDDAMAACDSGCDSDYDEGTGCDPEQGGSTVLEGKQQICKELDAAGHHDADAVLPVILPSLFPRDSPFYAAAAPRVTAGESFREKQGQFLSNDLLARFYSERGAAAEMKLPCPSMEIEKHIVSLVRQCASYISISPVQGIACAAQHVPLAKLVQLRLESNFSDSQLDDAIRILEGVKESQAWRVTPALRQYLSIPHVPNAHDVVIFSPVAWIHLLVSVPAIERHIICSPYNSPGDIALPELSVIREFYETPKYAALYEAIQDEHRMKQRPGAPFVVALSDWADKHGVFKGSCMAFLMSILNLNRRVRNQFFSNLFIAELRAGSQFADATAVRAAILPEMILLRHGIPMFIASTGTVQWVYGILATQVADTMEQYHNVGVHCPGGTASRLCCTRCLATRQDFSNGSYSSELLRNPVLSLSHLRRAADPSLSVKEACEILASVGLTEDALCVPTFFLVDDVFQIQARDSLHMGQWDIKLPLIYLQSKLQPQQLAVIESRIVAVRDLTECRLPAHLQPRPLRLVHMFKEYELLNMLFVFQLVFDDFVTEPDALSYFQDTASIHFLLSAGEVKPVLWPALLKVLYCSQRSALQRWFPYQAARELARKARKDRPALRQSLKKQPAARATAAAGDGSGSSDSDSDSEADAGFDGNGSDEEDDAAIEMQQPQGRPTLGNHNAAHVPEDVDNWGPCPNFSTGIYEHIAEGIARYARKSTRYSGEFASICYACRLQHVLSQIQNVPTSAEAKALSICGETLVVHSSEYVVYFGVPIFIGAIVCSIRPSALADCAGQLDSGTVPYLYLILNFAMVTAIQADSEELIVTPLIVPHQTPFFHAFPLRLSTCTEVWPFAIVHRTLWYGNCFEQRSSAYAACTICHVYPRFLNLK